MAKQNKSEKSGLSFVWGVATGVIVGGISALLFAPKKGSELRGDIKEGTAKVVEASTQTLQTVSSKAVEVGKAVEAKAVELVKEAKQTIQHFSKKEEHTAPDENGHEDAQISEDAQVLQHEHVQEDIHESKSSELEAQVQEDVQAIENVRVAQVQEEAVHA